MKLTFDKYESLRVFNANTFMDYAKTIRPMDIRDTLPMIDFFKRVAPLWDASKERIRANVYMPTHTYANAVYKSADAFVKSFSKGDIEKLIVDSFGCIITNSNLVYYYAFTHEFQFQYVMLGNKFVSGHWQMLDGTDDKTYDYFWCITKNEWLREQLGISGFDGEEACAFINSLVPFYVMMEKYSDVQNVTIGAGKKLKPTQSGEEKILNELTIDVNRRDSTWFTSVCREEGFMVSGHMRLQNYANGVKRLIYINPFEKHGYHRKAKIEA